MCVCSAAPADVCLLPMEEGNCGRYTLRWYFNSQVQACRPFIYSGCEGNDNRFLHLEECEELCLGEAEGTQTDTLTELSVLNVFRLKRHLLCRSSSLEDSPMIQDKFSTSLFCQMFKIYFCLFIVSVEEGIPQCFLASCSQNHAKTQ